MEFPPATVRIARMNLPAAGGGYLRIFPLCYTKWVFHQFERRRQSLVLYLHPWEIDPEQPRIAGKFKSKFRHYTNLHRTQERLENILRKYRFAPFRDHLANNPGVLPDAGELSAPGRRCAVN